MASKREFRDAINWYVRRSMTRELRTEIHPKGSHVGHAVNPNCKMHIYIELRDGGDDRGLAVGEDIPEIIVKAYQTWKRRQI